MKDRIIDIILENGWTDGNQKVAEEIESLVFEFANWMDSVENPFSKTIPVTKPVQYVNFFEGSKKKYVLKDIYDYWFKNIKNPVISMLPVTSSQIKSIGYAGSTLYIEFNKGTVYAYSDVPESFFEALKASESKGIYFGKEIKGKFDYAKTDRIVVNNELKNAE
jgi:hypothetical protein